MSLTSIISSSKKRDKEFKNILLSIEPVKEQYYTLSGSTPFSDDYKMLVPNELSDPYNSSLVGTAFDYLARFRIGQYIKNKDVHKGLVALSGFQKLSKRPEFIVRKIEEAEPYLSWFIQVDQFLKDASHPITDIYEIAVHLAKLEHFERRSVIKEEALDINYILFEDAPPDVIDELNKLMVVFEEKFMIPEVITKRSKVVFNPNFGVGSALVSGADADIFIDGTLYDFKTTQDKYLKKSDNLQLIGYYLLNELAVHTMSEDLGFQYEFLNMNKIAFYKARHGEIEYYDIEKHLACTSKEIRKALKETAEHFKSNQGDLNLHWMADINNAKELLEEIRNWDV